MYQVPSNDKELRNKNFNADLFTKMEIEEIKQKIAELAKAHHTLDMPDLDENQFAEMIEEDVTALILSYCQSQGYSINGFSPEIIRKVFQDKEGLEDNEKGDLNQELVQLFLDCLALEKKDVADICWCYQNSSGLIVLLQKKFGFNISKTTLNVYMMFNYEPGFQQVFLQRKIMINKIIIYRNPPILDLTP